MASRLGLLGLGLVRGLTRNIYFDIIEIYWSYWYWYVRTYVRIANIVHTGERLELELEA